jgi:subtilisin family serine protease
LQFLNEIQCYTDFKVRTQMNKELFKMKRVIFNVFLILALILAFSSTVFAQGNGPKAEKSAVAAPVTESVNGLYIVQMSDKPVVAYDGDIRGLKATKPKAGKKIDPYSPAVVEYVDYLTAKHNAALGKVGGQIVYNYTYSFNGFAAEMSVAEANKMAAVEGVLAVSGDEFLTMDTSTTPDFLGLTAEGGLWDLGVTGEDVIIGIVDSGFWPESQSFSDRTRSNPNGKEGKLGYQQIPGWHGKCTPGEEFNASMCNQKLIGAQYYNVGFGGDAGIDASRPWEYNSPRDYNGHGTHTASTAGGNHGVPAVANGVDLGTVNGMAPRARISAYKVCWSNEDASQASCPSTDSVAAIDQAVADGVDVINFSISGSRTNFLDPVEVAFLFAADAGVFVATSAGNSGPGAFTVAHNSPWLTTTAAGTHDRFYEGSVTLGNGDVFFGASLDPRGAGPADLVYAMDVVASGADADEARRCFPDTLDPAQVAGKIVLCDRGTIARVTKSAEVARAGGIGMIHANVVPSSINADLHSVPTVHIDHVDGAVARAYAQTSGATATLAGGDLLEAEAPFVAAFSSRGPSQASADLLKPDIMAPGVDVLAAVAPPGNAGRDFDFYSGTSMASPHIAGLAALLMEAYPDWTPMMVKSALMTTTSTQTNQGNPIPGDYLDYGAGQVVPNSAFDPGLVYDAGWIDWLGFLCGTGQLQASYCPFIGIDPSDLNYPSISIGALAGSQTVTRTVTNVGPAGTYDVSVDAPAGVAVAVIPSSLTLGAGESASYEVTFSATTSVVANQWTFGSLTWSHGPHHVTSPLSIFPVAIAAPAEIHETGTDGSLTFDITFGYTGDYNAAAHGLVPADMQAGTVADDPTDDIDSALATCDFSSFPYDCVGINWHEFTVPPGSAYARFSLFDDYTDGNDDLDLYIWRRSDGAFVGGSGSGTSAEEVNALLPVADVYEIAVHGWGTDGPDANYTLFNWAFGPDSGNMILTAPTSAVVATSDSVTVDWAGLSAGTKYLGAVSHSDGTDVLGMTLLRIDTD